MARLAPLHGRSGGAQGVLFREVLDVEAQLIDGLDADDTGGLKKSRIIFGQEDASLSKGGSDGLSVQR